MLSFQGRRSAVLHVELRHCSLHTILLGFIIIVFDITINHIILDVTTTYDHGHKTHVLASETLVHIEFLVDSLRDWSLIILEETERSGLHIECNKTSRGPTGRRVRPRLVFANQVGGLPIIVYVATYDLQPAIRQSRGN